MLKRNLAIAFTITALSGCSVYVPHWVKPGYTDTDMDRILTECQAQALAQLPPENVISGREIHKDKEQGHDDFMNPNNPTEDSQERISYTTTDANQGNRDILIKNCMQRQGWMQVSTKTSVWTNMPQ